MYHILPMNSVPRAARTKEKDKGSLLGRLSLVLIGGRLSSVEMVALLHKAWN